MIVFRFYLIAVFLSAFIPALNPARLSERIDLNASLFTCATSYSTITSGFTRALDRGWIESSVLLNTYIGALMAGIGIALAAAAFCLSLGNLKMSRLGLLFSFVGALTGIAGTTILSFSYNGFANASNLDHVQPIMPDGIMIYFVIFSLTLVFSAALWFMLPKHEKGDKYEIAAKYRLLLMILPFLVLVALFSYLPLWGWRISFYDYRPGIPMTSDDFVGWQWFTSLLSNPANRADITRVLRNTFAMSGLGLLFSWLPMAFAIFLSEITSRRTKVVVQTFTTIPNFISWVLVYSVAFAIFSKEGFYNWMLAGLGIIEAGEGFPHLLDSSNIWIKMWAWGTWKGLGFSAIIYIASISSIDPQLYEAATVDGAGRFKKMWHVTVPGLMSTFFVLLLLSISHILSNGMDQYLVFRNPANRSTIEVLDLYVYRLGLESGGNISLATLIGMLKSLISITLLFAANRASKIIRGESIV
jgi:putative aldouronate transport system permease protein